MVFLVFKHAPSGTLHHLLAEVWGLLGQAPPYLGLGSARRDRRWHHWNAAFDGWRQKVDAMSSSASVVCAHILCFSKHMDQNTLSWQMVFSKCIMVFWNLCTCVCMCVFVCLSLYLCKWVCSNTCVVCKATIYVCRGARTLSEKVQPSHVGSIQHPHGNLHISLTHKAHKQQP